MKRKFIYLGWIPLSDCTTFSSWLKWDVKESDGIFHRCFGFEYKEKDDNKVRIGKIKGNITGSFWIQGHGRVFTVEFEKYLKRAEVNYLMGKTLNGRKIIGIELQGTGEDCFHKDAGLLVRGE